MEEIYKYKNLNKAEDRKLFIKDLYKLFTKMLDYMRTGGIKLTENEEKVHAIIYDSIIHDDSAQPRKAIRTFITDMMYVLNMNHAVVEKVKRVDMKPGLIIPSRISIRTYRKTNTKPPEFEFSGHAVLLYYNGDRVMHISDPNFKIAANQPTFSYIYTKPEKNEERVDIFRTDSLSEVVGDARVLGGYDGEVRKRLRWFAMIAVMFIAVMVVVLIIHQLKRNDENFSSTSSFHPFT